jgi:hypothetical protein
VVTFPSTITKSLWNQRRGPLRPGRKVYQSLLELGDPPKTYLLRVFVDIDREPADVVTVYRTSKVDKYWRIGS